MEIHSYCFYVLVNSVLLFPSLLSKPVSLNDIIAAEEQSTSLQAPQLKIPENKRNRIRQLPKKYETISTTLTERMSGYRTQALQTDKKLSPLQYKKTFLIRAPLRPKKIKYINKTRNRRINTTAKREAYDDEIFNKKYIPLLRRLGVLFNNLLDSDSGNDDVTDEHYNKQKLFSRNKGFPHVPKSQYDSTGRKSSKKTTVITSTVTPEISTKVIILPETSSASTNNTFNNNLSPLRRYKNVPILSARNTTSSWGNYNGFSEGSLSTYYRNSEGYIAGNNGSDENNNTGRETTESISENYKQHTNSGSGDNANCDGTCRAIGRNRDSTSNTANEELTIKATVRSNETASNDRGDGNQFERFDKFETGRNETESRIFLSQSSSRLRGFQPKEQTTEILWQIQKPKESNIDVTLNVTRTQRISDRDRSVAEEDQEIRRADKKLTLNDISSSLINASRSNLAQDKQKFVVIYDGYSVARDVNGENKLTEKSLQNSFIMF